MSNGEKKLNDEQLEAVKHDKGPLLIIAGAGTGKTTVVTERIKWLISQNLAHPAEILALTFTEKAVREMEERVDIAMPYGYTQMWISTFHSFCDRVLRNEAVHIGLSPDYRLMTEAETIIFLRASLFKFELNYFRPLGNPNKFIGGMLQHFSRLKDEDIEPEEYLNFTKGQNLPEEERKKILELVKAYRIYEELKTKGGMADFADLIANTLKLFRARPNILSQYQKQFKYVLVDEFQDTNFAQYNLLKILAPPMENPNLTVVGDDSQSIYKFRGAAISNILQFMEEYKRVKQVILTKNYRSTQTILDHAHRLIKFNDPDTLEVKLGISKNLKRMRKVDEEKVEWIHAERVEDEAEEIARKIKQLKKTNYEFKDFAILFRANSHAEPFTRALVRAGVPYQFLGPGMLFRQPEVKDLIAYLKVLYNVEDSVAFYRVLAMDIFEISARDVAALTSFAKKTNLSLLESCELATGKENGRLIANTRPIISEETKIKLEKIVAMVNRHLKLLSKESAGQILYYFLSDSGLLSSLTVYKNAQDEKRAQNVSKFFGKIKSYEVTHEDAAVSAVVDWIEMSQELGESPQASDTDWAEVNAVNLLTVHSSKGLEFPVVFLVNLVAQRFPTTERQEQIPIPQDLIKEILPEGDAHLEEERRLFYVGMTRAKDRLFLTSANFYGEGKRERKISPFVGEALGEEVFGKQKINASSKQLSFLEWAKPVEPETAVNRLNSRPLYLSYSQIEAFMNCPLHYKLKFILKIPTPPSSAQSFGISLHAALRDFYRLKITDKNPGEEKLLALLKENWVGEGYKSKKHEDLLFQQGERFLHEFWLKTKDSQITPLALEKSFVFPLRSFRVVGRLDRVDSLGDGKIEIIDYKTGSRPPSQKEVDQNLQLTIYALAATEVLEPPLGKKPEEVFLSLYFFENSQKITTVRTKEQLEKAKEEIFSWAEKIAQSDFRCTKSELCKYCEYKLLCDTD
ncbi:ATP-dependent helicase [Candidatus Microgenomates bacterium]|nr:ATP-dependent helicase [Candidatus Microgenomates bacterium]